MLRNILGNVLSVIFGIILGMLVQSGLWAIGWDPKPWEVLIVLIPLMTLCAYLGHCAAWYGVMGERV